MGSTTILKLPYPEESDTADVPRDIQALANRTELTLAVPIVTPAQLGALTPTDGLVVDMVVDATNNILWRLRYQAAIADQYKWCYVGGPPLQAYSAAANGLATGAWSYIGPALANPRPGIYQSQINTTIQGASGGAAIVTLSGGQYSGGAAARNLFATEFSQTYGVGTGGWGPFTTIGQTVALPAGAQPIGVAQASIGGVQATQTVLTLQPIRIG